MKLLTFALMAFLTVACSNATPKVVTSKRNLVYNLMVDHEAICTAFAVRSENVTYAISAGHCAKDLEVGAKAELLDSTNNNKLIPIKLKRAAEKWPTEDFSIWEFEESAPLIGIPITANIPKLGDPVWAFVGPIGSTPYLVGGLYSGIAGCAEGGIPVCEVAGLYAVNTSATNGASGSPVLDSNGQVWGILVGGNDALPGEVFVVRMPIGN